MWFQPTLYNSGSHLIVQFGWGVPVNWFPSITTFCSRDYKERLVGVEVFLYDYPNISLEKVAEQFAGYGNVELEHGILWVPLRESAPGPGPSFGREADISTDGRGYLATLEIPWNQDAAGTPVVDATRALDGLPHRTDLPT